LNDNFSWGRFATDVGVASGTALLTFGAGYSAGYYNGIALRNATNLSVDQIKLCSALSGAVAGAVSGASKVLLVGKFKGKKVDPFQIVFGAGAGAWTGACAGYLGAVAVRVPDQALVATGNQVGRMNEFKDDAITIHAADVPMYASDVCDVLELTKDSKTLILTGTHGDEQGKCFLDALCAKDPRADSYKEKLFFLEDQSTVKSMGLEGTTEVIDMSQFYTDGASKQESMNCLISKLNAGRYDNIIVGWCYGQRSELVRQCVQKFQVHVWQYGADVAATLAGAFDTWSALQD